MNMAYAAIHEGSNSGYKRGSNGSKVLVAAPLLSKGAATAEGSVYLIWHRLQPRVGS